MPPPGEQGSGAAPPGGEQGSGAAPPGEQDHGAMPATGGQGPGAPASPPVWPCTGCGGPVALDLDVCPVCGSTFLDGLRADDQPKRRAMARFSAMSRGARLAAGASVGVMIALLLYLLMTLL